jgi:hypothetical protein
LALFVRLLVDHSRASVGTDCSITAANKISGGFFMFSHSSAVEGRLPRGIGVERLRDLPAEWSRQFEALGLNPECS